ncbi:MAG: histidine phosphatase family protein [Quinella sp. 3Q1]|nr:histidine phosphatase family protein [Quinella sp. 3Q1]
MTRIFLVRHGETEWNKSGILQGNSDIALTAEGIRQAHLLADYAPFQRVDAIYSSDLIRAVDTAKILAEKFNLPVNLKGGLRETNFGDCEGIPLNVLLLKKIGGFEHFFTRPDKVNPPNGETFLQCQARVLNALDEIVADHENQNVVIVSHGAAIRLMLCAALSMPIRKMWAIAQFNMAVNILRVDEGNVTVELINSTAHLHLFEGNELQ